MSEYPTIEETGIPADWKIGLLGDYVAKRGKGITPHKTPDREFELYSVPNHEKGMPEIVTGRNIGSNKQIVEEGTVLLCKINPRINRSWVVSTYSEHWKIASTEWIAFPPSDDFEPKYLAYYLNQTTIRDFLAANASGVGGSLMRVKPTTIQNYPFPIAPRDQQNRLIAEIEKQFSRLDRAVASLKCIKANLKRYKSAVLKAAVEGKLTEEWRKQNRDVEPASKLLERIKKPPRPHRYSTRSQDVIPGHAALSVGNTRSRLPDKWSWVALVDIARMESGHTPERKRLEWWDGGIPWIGIGDARKHDGGVICDTEQHTNQQGLANSASRLLPENTVCISRTASVGYVVVMARPMATSQDFVNWIPTAAVSHDWLRIIFSADREVLRRFGKGSVHKTIYFPEWLSMHVAIPPVSEQRMIVESVDRLVIVATKLEFLVEEQLTKMEIVRQGVLKAAFSGNL